MLTLDEQFICCRAIGIVHGPFAVRHPISADSGEAAPVLKHGESRPMPLALLPPPDYRVAIRDEENAAPVEQTRLPVFGVGGRVFLRTQPVGIVVFLLWGDRLLPLVLRGCVAFAAIPLAEIVFVPVVEGACRSFVCGGFAPD